MFRTYLKLKACPKCEGDILVGGAVKWDDDVCIQCGFRGFPRIADDEGPEDRLRKTVSRARRRTSSRVTGRV